MTEDILIAGGGIGGLTAAIALRRAGFPVQVGIVPIEKGRIYWFATLNTLEQIP